MRWLSRQIFDFVYSIFQKNSASFPSRVLLQSHPPIQALSTRGSDRRRRWLAERKKGISSISQRVAVTVSVMVFGSVVESNSCANQISGLLRVYFRTRVARPGIGVRVSFYRGQADFHATDIGLFLSINDRPACPVIFFFFHRFSSFSPEVTPIRQNILAYLCSLA